MGPGPGSHVADDWHVPMDWQLMGGMGLGESESETDQKAAILLTYKNSRVSPFSLSPNWPLTASISALQ